MGRSREVPSPGREDAAEAPAFASFVMGGFEGSSHRRRDGRQLDLIAQTGHDARVAEDYALLRAAGIGTARDALRWHRIETAPGRYDWSSAVPMLRAARRAGLQVIWDLCHYGLPHDLDIGGEAFADRFAAYARAAASVIAEESGAVPIVCPINEMSFWAWAGGDHKKMYPHMRVRGPALKRQLVRAALAGIGAMRVAIPGVRTVTAEPLIHVVGRGEDQAAARAYSEVQFEATDMLCGRVAPELGGWPGALDVVGLNFYADNQWYLGGATVPMGHRAYEPLSRLLEAAHARYGRPLLLTETGAEGENGPGWLRYVGGEVRAARAAGVRVAGMCVYPVMDYPGWDNGRHCRTGLIRVEDGWRARAVDGAMAAAIAEQIGWFEEAEVGRAQGRRGLG